MEGQIEQEILQGINTLVQDLRDREESRERGFRFNKIKAYIAIILSIISIVAILYAGVNGVFTIGYEWKDIKKDVTTLQTTTNELERNKISEQDLERFRQDINEIFNDRAVKLNHNFKLANPKAEYIMLDESRKLPNF